MSSERLKILIVEDETLVGMGLQDQLTRLGHTVVAQAASAADALEQFRTRQPDVVLVDVRLNGGDGIELAQECLKIRRVPMIVISAYSDPELIQRAGEAGVFGYLVKPVEQGQLAAQLPGAVRRVPGSEQHLPQKEHPPPHP